MLPAPVGVVLDFDIVEDDAAALALMDNIGVGDDSGALELVLTAAFAPPAFTALVAMALPLVFPVATLAALPVLLIEAHLVTEATDHILEELGLLLAVFFGPLVCRLAGVEVLLFSLRLPLLLGLLPDILHLLPVGLLARLFLVKHSDNHRGSTASLSDLEEGVVMAKGSLALRTVIEVLADSALVTDSRNRSDVATVALHIGVHDDALLL